MESKVLDDLYKEWYGESHLVNSNKAVHDSSEAMDFANHCMDKQQSKIDKLEERIIELCVENGKLSNCCKSIYKSDLPMIDRLCDISGFHKFELMRTELKLLVGDS